MLHTRFPSVRNRPLCHPSWSDEGIKHFPRARGKSRSQLLGVPELDKQESRGDYGGGGQSDEEEVDECVHACEQNTGGRTSAGIGRDFLKDEGWV